jgi:hypothetical protein
MQQSQRDTLFANGSGNALNLNGEHEPNEAVGLVTGNNVGSCVPVGTPRFPERLLPEEDSSTHRGRMANGDNWTVTLGSPGLEDGPSEFTNSAGVSVDGFWRTSNSGICQSYNERESWVCHDLFACDGEENLFAMRNANGEFTSVIEGRVNGTTGHEVNASDIRGVFDSAQGAVSDDAQVSSASGTIEKAVQTSDVVESALRSGNWDIGIVSEDILRGLLIAKGMIKDEVDTTGMNQFETRRAIEEARLAGLGSWDKYEKEDISISFPAIPTMVSWDGFYFRNNEYIACLPSGVKFGNLELKLQIDHALDAIWYHNSGLGPDICRAATSAPGGPEYAFAFRASDPLRVIVSDEAQAEEVYLRYKAEKPFLRFNCNITEVWFDSATCRIEEIELAVGRPDSLETIYGVSRAGYYWK